MNNIHDYSELRKQIKAEISDAVFQASREGISDGLSKAVEKQFKTEVGEVNIDLKDLSKKVADSVQKAVVQGISKEKVKGIDISDIISLNSKDILKEIEKMVDEEVALTAKGAKKMLAAVSLAQSKGISKAQINNALSQTGYKGAGGKATSMSDTAYEEYFKNLRATARLSKTDAEIFGKNVVDVVTKINFKIDQLVEDTITDYSKVTSSLKQNIKAEMDAFNKELDSLSSEDFDKVMDNPRYYEIEDKVSAGILSAKRAMAMLLEETDRTIGHKVVKLEQLQDSVENTSGAVKEQEQAFEKESEAINKVADKVETLEKKTKKAQKEIVKATEKVSEVSIDEANQVAKGSKSRKNNEPQTIIVETNGKLQETNAILSETDKIIQRITYHFGNFALGKPSHQFGGEIQAWFTGQKNGGRGWADGTGTYVTSNPNEFKHSGDFSDPLKKFYAIDTSDLKLYEQHIEEDAQAYYDFSHKLEQFCYKMGASFEGFDDNLKDINPSTLYVLFEKLFGKSKLAFDEFNQFIEDMIGLVKESGIKADGSIDSMKIFRFKQKHGSDDIKTRFLQKLGYQGTDFSGTSFDSIRDGSVIFQNVDKNIIKTGATIDEVMVEIQNDFNKTSKPIVEIVEEVIKVGTVIDDTMEKVQDNFEQVSQSIENATEDAQEFEDELTKFWELRSELNWGDYEKVDEDNPRFEEILGKISSGRLSAQQGLDVLLGKEDLDYDTYVDVYADRLEDSVKEYDDVLQELEESVKTNQKVKEELQEIQNAPITPSNPDEEFMELPDEIKNLDDDEFWDHVADMKKNISSITTSTEGVKDAIFKNILSPLEQANKVGKEFSNRFNIKGPAVSTIKEEFAELLRGEKNDFTELVIALLKKAYQEDFEEENKQYSEVREYIKTGGKLYVNESVKGDLGDRFNDFRKLMGVGKVTTTDSSQLGYDVYLRGLNEYAGTTFSNLSELYDFLENKPAIEDYLKRMVNLKILFLN